MERFIVIAAAVFAMSAHGPALAACKTAKCPPKPVAKATAQTATPAAEAAPKTCVIAGKAQPCKVKSHDTNVTTRQALRF